MFKKLVLSCFAALIAVSTVIDTAEAARLGSRRSSGIQRQIVPPQRQAVPPTTSPQQQYSQNPAARPTPTSPQPTAQPSGWRRWAGPLAGIAAGLGLAALLSHFGLSGEFAGLLLGILLIVIVIALLRRLMAGKSSHRPAPAYAGYGASPQEAPAAFEAARVPATQESSPRNVPPGFDVTSFERQAKVNFVRLQAANDAGNLADIREFTSPEMFAEIKLDIDSRAGKPQKTDVVMLDAEVLEVAEENGRYIASVHFSGTLREEDGKTPEPFSEVWHLTKPVNGSQGWVLAGIQQIA